MKGIKNRMFKRKKINELSYCLKLPVRSAFFLYFAFLVFTLICAVAPSIELILWKYILDSLEQTLHGTNFTQSFIFLIVIYFIAGISSKVAENVKSIIESKLKDKMQLYIDLEIMNKYNKLEAGFYDDPLNMDTLDVVKNSKMMICEGVLQLVEIIKTIVNFILMAIVLVSISPIVTFVYVLLLIPQVTSSTKLDTLLNMYDVEATKEKRKKDYYRSILISKKYAKDLRVYRIRDFILEKYNTEWQKILKDKNDICTKTFSQIYRNEILEVMGYLIMIVFVIYKAIYGAATIGDISVVVSATRPCSEAFKDFYVKYKNFRSVVVTRLKMYVDFINKTDRDEDGVISCSTINDIEFCNVYFKYPFGSEYILEDISFKINSGTKNAIVGKNGEGKSTIIKLLLRLYRPEKGNILINGINIEEYNIKSLRERFSACFQDVSRYALTVEENITFKERTLSPDKLNYLTTFSGIYDKIDSFEQKYEAELTKEFSDKGEELSGGQWQMLAISRSLCKNADFLVFDEPSSALDAITEDRIMELLSKLSKEKTILVISHRLSCLQDYDQIIVLNNNKIEEIGNHKQLMQKGGLYSKMYSLQKDKYVQEESELS